MLRLKGFMIVMGMAVSGAGANLNWESFEGLSPTNLSIFIGVGDSIWIGNPDSIVAVDTSFKNPRPVHFPFARPPIELKWEFNSLLALDGENWWKSVDRGRTWQACESDCRPLQPAIQNNSAYLSAGQPIQPIRTDWHEPNILPTSKGRLHSVPGAILRKSSAQGSSEWQMVAYGWSEDMTLSLYRVAKGILAIPERLHRDSGEFMVPNARPAFLSQDEGDTWQEVRPEEAYCITAVASQGKWICHRDTSLDVQLKNPLVISSDSGLTWSPLFTHPNPSNQALEGQNAFLFEDAWAVSAIIQDKIHLFFSQDKGATWRDGTPTAPGILHLSPHLFRIQSQWVLFTESGLWVTANSGQTWTLKPLPPQLPGHHYFNALATQNQLWYTRENGDVFTSSDLGDTWLPQGSATRLKGISNGILMGERSEAWFISDDNGKTWEPNDAPVWSSLGRHLWHGLTLLPTSIGLYSSTDSGKSWRILSDGGGVGLTASIRGMNAKGDSLLVTTDSGVYLLKKSQTGFSSWTRLSTQQSPTLYGVLLGDNLAIAYSSSLLLYFQGDAVKAVNLNPNTSRQFTFIANRLYSLESGSILAFDPKSTTFITIPSPLQSYPSVPVAVNRQLAVQNGKLYCLTPYGLFQSDDTGKTWDPKPAPKSMPQASTLRRGLNGLVIQTGNTIWHRHDRSSEWKNITATNATGTFLTRHLSDSIMVICNPIPANPSIQVTPNCLIRQANQEDWAVLETLPGYLVPGRYDKLFAVSGNSFMIRKGSQGEWREIAVTNCAYVPWTWSVHEIGRRLIAREVCSMKQTQILISSDRGDTWRNSQTSDTLPDFSSILEAPPFYYWKDGDRYWLSNDEFNYEAPNMGAISLVGMGNHLVFGNHYHFSRTVFPNQPNSLAVRKSQNRKVLTRSRKHQGTYRSEFKDGKPNRLILVNGRAVEYR